MKKSLITTGCIAVIMALFSGCTMSGRNGDTGISVKWIDRNLQDAAEQYKILMQELPKGVMPETYEDDSLKTCSSRSWVAGFYPGTLTYLYEATKDSALYREAVKRVTLMKDQQYNTGTHDLGFMMYCSYGTLYHVTPDDRYKQILINAANSLASRFNPKVGCVRSWGKSDDTTKFRVIIDNMMNLELLLWATKATGDSSFYKIAVSHANTTMKNHFRPDYSSFHVVVYNPRTGKIMAKRTAQGASDSSAWARGQSWGLYGYTMMYRETKDKRYLDQAQHIAKFILNNPHLPADKVPFWDYDAPSIPEADRDASAAAIMASALIELSGYSNDTLSKQYLETAAVILHTLSSPEYKAAAGTNGGFILKHSVGNMNKDVQVNVPLPYADYYYVEALMRYRKYLNDRT